MLHTEIMLPMVHSPGQGADRMGVTVSDCLTTGVELNRLEYGLQGF